MIISSPFFTHNEGLNIDSTCDGKGVNPPLEISEAPKKTKSLALIMKDPDAPGAVFIHWLVWNIPPDTRKIKENSVPDNAQCGMTSVHRASYVAACPPSGTHRYFFCLYALDTVFDLAEKTTAAEFEYLINGHILAEAHMIGLYR